MSELPSLSIFFPFFNDAGTVELAISQAYNVGRTVTKNLEVIAIHGGASKDTTWQEILKQKKKHPDLVVIDKKDNTEGYAVIKYGFEKASKEWVFYTDGDLQYTVSELTKLVALQKKTGADVINGYKVYRGDRLRRTVLGTAYQHVSHFLFQLPIRDTDCDFRLIKRSFLKSVKLQARDASILPELIKKLQRAGATFEEVAVSHKKRMYGHSNYSTLQLLKEKIVGDVRIWWMLRKGL